MYIHIRHLHTHTHTHTYSLCPHTKGLSVSTVPLGGGFPWFPPHYGRGRGRRVDHTLFHRGPRTLRAPDVTVRRGGGRRSRGRRGGRLEGVPRRPFPREITLSRERVTPPLSGRFWRGMVHCDLHVPRQVIVTHYGTESQGLPLDLVRAGITESVSQRSRPQLRLWGPDLCR